MTTVERIPDCELIPVPDDLSEATEFLRGEIEETRQLVTALDRDYRAKRKRLTRHETKLAKALEATRSRVRQERSRARQERRERSGSELDPHVQAGGKNIAKATDYFRRAKVATQAAFSRETGIGSGTTTWTIKALLEDGVIEPTGSMIGQSREFRYVPQTKRVTRVRPGE